MRCGSRRNAISSCNSVQCLGLLRLRLQIFELEAQVDAAEMLVDIQHQKAAMMLPAVLYRLRILTGSTWRTRRELSIFFTV